MQNALASRVAAWFSEIESNSGKHPSSEKLQSLPLLGRPMIFNDAEKASNIPELITTQIMDFVFSYWCPIKICEIGTKYRHYRHFLSQRAVNEKFME